MVVVVMSDFVFVYVLCILILRQTKSRKTLQNTDVGWRGGEGLGTFSRSSQ